MSGFNVRNNPYPSPAYRWGGRAPGFRGLGDFLAHHGLGDDSTDIQVLSGTNTPDNTNIFDLMSPAPAITTSLAPEPTMSASFPSSFLYDIASTGSSAFQQAQSTMASWFTGNSSPSPSGAASLAPSVNISAQDLQNYWNGTAGPDVTAALDSALANMGLPFGTCAGPGCGPSSSGGASSSSVNSNLAASLAQQWTNITGKILQQVTLPAGQIQITGPNGQSEIIQTSANTAGIGIPGLNVGNTSGLFSLVLIGGGIFLLVRLLEQH